MSGLIFSINTTANAGFAYVIPVEDIQNIQTLHKHFFLQFNKEDAPLINEQVFTEDNVKTLQALQKVNPYFMRFQGTSSVEQFKKHMPAAKLYNNNLQPKV